VLHDVHAYDNLSFAEVVIESSNIGIVKIAQGLEPDSLHHYIRGFGFGAPTNIDFPGEASGYTRPPSEWSKTSPYNIPMGHEIMVTALQMARAMSVIANGGYLVTPYLVDKVIDQAGVVLEKTKPPKKKRVIRSDVAKEMRDILGRVVSEGTGRRAQIPGVEVGGKTGTAQKVLPDGEGYSHENFMSSFLGFAPVDKPRLVMAIVLDDPKPSYYGGTVAGPVFKEVVGPALIHLGYVPRERLDGDLSMPKTVLPDNPPTPLLN